MNFGKNTVAYGLMLAGALIVAAPASVPAANTTSSSVGVPGASSESGTLNCSQLESLWEKAGGSPASAHMAAEIAMAESRGRENATLHNTNGTTDEGYWQINTSHGSLATYDPLGNAKSAVQISGNGTDWSPWVTFQKGLYAGQCP